LTVASEIIARYLKASHDVFHARIASDPAIEDAFKTRSHLPGDSLDTVGVPRVLPAEFLPLWGLQRISGFSVSGHRRPALFSSEFRAWWNSILR